MRMKEKEGKRGKKTSFIVRIKGRSVRGVIGPLTRYTHCTYILDENQVRTLSPSPSPPSSLSLSLLLSFPLSLTGHYVELHQQGLLPPVGRIKNYARITAHERIFVISANESTAHISELPQPVHSRAPGNAKSGRGELLTHLRIIHIFVLLFWKEKKYYFCLRFRQKWYEQLDHTDFVLTYQIASKSHTRAIN